MQFKHIGINSVAKTKLQARNKGTNSARISRFALPIEFFLVETSCNYVDCQPLLPIPTLVRLSI